MIGERDGVERDHQVMEGQSESARGRVVVSDTPNLEWADAPSADDQFRLLVDGVLDYAIFGLDIDGLVTTWNSGAERIKGYRAEEIIGRHFSVFYPSEAVAAGVPQEELVEAAALGSVKAEGWRVRKDGSRFWADVVITALYDDDGHLEGFAKVSRDVTERRAAEQSIREAEERARTLDTETRVAAIVESSDDLIASCSLDGLIMSWNSAAERILGYTAKEMIGQTFLHARVQMLPADRPDEVRGMSERVALGGPGGQTEVQRIHKDGSVIDMQVSVSPIRDSSGTLIGVSNVGRDITARKAAEMALRDSENRSHAMEARLAAIVESSDDAIMSWSTEGIFTSWNRAAERLFGYRAEETVGRKRSDMVSTMVPAELTDELTDFSPRRFETHRTHRNGAVVDVLLTMSQIHDAAGILIGTAGVARDITERKKHDQVLALERRRLRAAESIGHIGSWEMDAATQEVVWSKTVLALYGIGPDDFDGQYASVAAFIHPDDQDEVAAAIEAGMAGNETFWVRYRVIRADNGEPRWFDAHGERVYEEGRFVRLAGTVVDVTEVVSAAKVMEGARDLALEASRQKSAFLATMSHEIRTPMNAVIGMTDLLLDTALDAEQREFGETISSSGDALLGIINDILDFSKIEAGGVELHPEPFDLRTCVEDALNLVAVDADGKGLELVSHVDERCPLGVVGDVTRLRQVLVNLLGNAVKFTAEGRIVFTVELVGPVGSDDNIGAVGLRFAVADAGIGIPAERLAHLFDSFSQVDSSTTRAYGGSGLGLAISHRLVEAMGATIGVESVSGAGSTFHFTVSLVSAAELSIKPSPATTLSGRLALIVDDNATNRRILRHQLEDWKMDVTEAADADVAMALVATGQRFDVAVIDMKLPGMTGADLAARLRSSPDTILMPLILLSSHMERLLPEQGDLFSAVLTIPVPADRLRASLRDALKAVVPSAALLGPPVPRATGWRRLRVLVAEDNPVNQLVCRRLLDKLGHDVDVAGNGLEALEAIRLVPYDVVLMDIQMPKMDGLEATRLIRSELSTDRQPHIVAVTASVLVEDRQACADAGMDDYLPKPVRLEDLDIALSKAVLIHSR
jgi:PAS domain S-box-containing protein